MGSVTPRSLTWDDAEQLRSWRDRFGTSFENLGRIFRIEKTQARAICVSSAYRTPEAWSDVFDSKPTPPEQIDATIWHAGETWDVSLPSQSLTPSISATKCNEAADRYAAANQRDGYLTDPAYLAAVAAWKAGDLPDALALAAD